MKIHLLDKLKERIVFISWTPFGRHTELLGKALDAEIFFIDKFIKGKLWKLIFPIDYLLKSLKTFIILWKTKPDIVFVQNPPSIAAIVIVLLSKTFKFKSVIDSHNGAFEKPWLSVPFHIWALKNADIVTIHNKVLFDHLSGVKKFTGINFKILNSRLSAFPLQLKDPSTEKYFLIISSYSDDEPMEVLLDGIARFSEKEIDIKFKVTGKYERKIELYNKYCQINNLEFLGFVDNKTYDHLLVNAYGIIALSTRDDVQQFALMEAIGAQVPFISNNNKTNIDLFDEKMILIENSPLELVRGITDFIANKDELKNNIIDIKLRQTAKWDREFNDLLEHIHSLIK